MNISQIEKKFQKFCWCSLPLLILRQYYKGDINETTKVTKSFKTPLPPVPNAFDSDICQISEDSQRISKSDLNLELLKDYEYETVTRGGEVDDKPITIYICKYENCNKEFTRTWNILDHARMHKGVKPFQCHLCVKTFTQKGNLKKHLKTHMLPDVESRKRYK